MTDSADWDVVDVLAAEHERITTLVARIRANREDKQQLFDELVRLLAIHESVEEEVVHRAARRATFSADEMVKSRLAEEHRAKHHLADLYDLGVEHPEFDAEFARFAYVLIAHIVHEENEEFPLLRKQFSETQLHRLAESVHAAESLAPTRPHPRLGESAVANALAGPPFAIFDRIRDAIRDHRIE